MSSAARVSLETVEEAILSRMVRDGALADSLELAAEQGWDHQAVVGAIKSLELAEMVTSSTISRKAWVLTGEGERVVEHGSPEMAVMARVPADGVDMGEWNAAVAATEDAAEKAALRIGLATCMKKRWLTKDKAANRIVRKVDGEVEDDLRVLLRKLAAAGGSVDVVGEKSDDGKTIKKRKMAVLK